MLNGKTIIVTGAASGIGAETARIVKEQGGTVIGLDINETKENVDQFILVNMSNPASIDEAIAAIPDGIDGICNIAGVPPTQDRALVLKVNFLGLRDFTEKMIAKMNDNGAIVNVASLAGLGWPQAQEQVKALLELRDFDAAESFCIEHDIVNGTDRSYSLTKEALIVWAMQTRWTWRDRGIRMNNVSPGPVDTPILKDFIETLGKRVEEDRKIMDRDGAASDIAPVIAFLCSDGSAWIRGANIPTDGGMYQHVMVNMHGYA